MNVLSGLVLILIYGVVVAGLIHLIFFIHDSINE